MLIKTSERGTDDLKEVEAISTYTKPVVFLTPAKMVEIAKASKVQ